MSFGDYVESRILFVLFQISFMFLLTITLCVMSVPWMLIIELICSFLCLFSIYLFLDYQVKKRDRDQIYRLVDQLEEKYLISEVLKKPRHLEKEGYYYALKQASKAMNDRISDLEKERTDYREYIESFAHEIKTPLAAISLYCDNESSAGLKEEVKKIDCLVEQVLYYARSENPEKDYFVKEIALDLLLHPLLLDYKDYLLKKKVVLEVYDLDKIVYTDEKWVSFIFSQILQNAIKYLDKKEKKIEIFAVEKTNSIDFVLRDNGVGISAADLSRVFEKGFTGTNRTKQYSTGIGLYLCKKLADQLNLGLSITSEEGHFTEVVLCFPKSNLHKMDK